MSPEEEVLGTHYMLVESAHWLRGHLNSKEQSIRGLMDCIADDIEGFADHEFKDPQELFDAALSSVPDTEDFKVVVTKVSFARNVNTKTFRAELWSRYKEARQEFLDRDATEQEIEERRALSEYKALYTRFGGKNPEDLCKKEDENG
jgi:hypothetical protein